MRLLPHGIAAQRPRCPDPDEPVPFRVREQDADIVEHDATADGQRHVRTDLGAAIPEDDLQVHEQHEQAEHNYETVVIRPKCRDVRS